MELEESSKVYTLEERFWEKVDKKGEDECWNWNASRMAGGYGKFKYNGETVGAHRISWILHHNNIPEDIQVLHRCDNRKCVNPKHLFLGTHQDNMKDMENKNRCYMSRGEKNPNSKLTWDEVNKIRNEYNNGKKCFNLAKEYNMTVQQIRHIVKNRQWKIENVG